MRINMILSIIFMLLGFVLFLLLKNELLLIEREVPPETPCEDITGKSVIFAPAFDNLGKDTSGKYIPGKANENIARKLEKCADRFDLILTQKAVSDAIKDTVLLRKVYEMHKDIDKYINTIQAFKCALERFEEPPEQIVLLTHPRHLERALFDLEALYKGKIIIVHLGDASYETPSRFRAYKWAVKNTGAWIIDRRTVASFKKGKTTIDCPEGALLPRIPL